MYAKEMPYTRKTNMMTGGIIFLIYRNDTVSIIYNSKIKETARIIK